ncbi:hypothetical protein PAXRUDRAFT_24426 [Paxillus rubicundulus Ve08.2h10]|uniref:Unplaced genomic scaffold scaffold_92, whole genome shotgun sequence n=1 Tax=Paxillus rubicundulus Ve08.2h10 TaxID=930991 RepID=A0A0D0EBN6_9AGAM|nr:hypothetical protein PAXRUDRAFT_24426 [Paxillus rubicundulus Ve08.2h10]
MGTRKTKELVRLDDEQKFTNDAKNTRGPNYYTPHRAESTWSTSPTLQGGSIYYTPHRAESTLSTSTSPTLQSPSSPLPPPVLSGHCARMYVAAVWVTSICHSTVYI